MKIGLRLYQVKLTRNHDSEKLQTGAAPNDVAKVAEGLVNAASVKPLNDGISKIIRFEPKATDGFLRQGLMWYGSYGYETQVENVNSGDTEYTRGIDEADTIPLYYGFWFPPNCSCGLLALQSYGGRSCADFVRRALAASHKQFYPDYLLTTAKLMPNELEIFGESLVKRVRLVKKRADPKILTRALRPEQEAGDIDVELFVGARDNSGFGKLKDLGGKIKGHLALGDLEFEDAFAEVKVGGEFKKIGVLGAKSSAGVIDVTDQVDFDSSRHPKWDSISKVAAKEIFDFARTLGI